MLTVLLILILTSGLVFRGDELFGGELNSVTEIVGGVRGAGELEGGEAMTDGKGDFAGEGGSVFGDDLTGENAAGVVGEQLDEAEASAVNFAGGGVAELDEGLFIADVIFAEIGFGGSRTGDAGEGVDEAGQTAIVWLGSGLAGEETGEEAAFVAGALGAGAGSVVFVESGFLAVLGGFGRFGSFGSFGGLGGRGIVGLTEGAIADGENVLGGSLEEFVDLERAVAVELDAGAVEAVVEGGSGAGGEDNGVDANHFFGAGVLKNGVLGERILRQSRDAGISEHHDAEVVDKMRFEGGTDFGIFVREEAGGLFGDQGLGAKGGVVFGELAAGGAAADDEDDSRQAADFESGFGGKVTNGVKTGDAGGVEVGAGGENEVFGSELAFADDDGVRVDEVGVAGDVKQAGIFGGFRVVAAGGFDDCFHLVCDQGGEAEAEFLEAEFGQVEGFVVRVGEVESDGVRDVESIEVGTAVATAFNESDIFLGFSKTDSGGGTGGATADYHVSKVIFPTHFILFYHDFDKYKRNRDDIF